MAWVERLQPRTCQHCKRTTDTRIIRTGVPGTKPVYVSVCKCDAAPQKRAA